MKVSKKVSQWSTLILCCITASLIFKLPYLRETYYAALQKATGTTNAQLGTLMSVFGIFNLAFYIPSGWLADKFSARFLMTFSLLATGLSGFYYATFPPYIMLLILHALWAFTTTFAFWAICVRIVRECGESKEQGRIFGYWYLGKGITSMVVGVLSVPLFAKFGEGEGGLRATIIFYSALIFLSGIVSWFTIDEGKIKNSVHEEKSSFRAADMKEIFKKPTMWVAGVIPFCMWSIYIGFGMVTPYLTDILKISQSQAAMVSVLRAYVLLAIGAIIGGKLADRCVSRTRFMVYVFIGMIVFTIGFILLPDSSNMLMLALANMVALGAFVYSVNAVFFSLIDEINIPGRLTGTAVGIMSLLAYSSEAYSYTMVGEMVDKNEGILGYRIVFIFMLICAIVGLSASLILQKMNKGNQMERKRKEQEENA